MGLIEDELGVNKEAGLRSSGLAGACYRIGRARVSRCLGEAGLYMRDWERGKLVPGPSDRGLGSTDCSIPNFVS